MFKRIACSMLWLVAVAWAFNFLSAYMGVPQVMGSVLAVAVAAFVGIDPLKVIWPAAVASSTRDLVAPTTSRLSNHI